MSSEQLPVETKPDVILVDLSGMVHQIFHIAASEPDPDYTFKTVVNRVHALAQGCDHVAVCCDSGKSFRVDISPEYKAKRPERDEVLQHQMMLTRETLAKDGFPVWAVPGFEADDLIASATASAGALGLNVLIVSGDKDLLALVQDGPPSVKVKRIQTGAVMDSEAVAAKFNILPVQVVDYLCLVGDTSDNVKGARGIGEKRAADMLRAFGTIEDMYAAIDSGAAAGKFTPATLASLQEFRGRWPDVRSLITMRTDVPIPFDEVLEPRAVPPMASEAEPEPQEELVPEPVDDIEYAMGPYDGKPSTLPPIQDSSTGHVPEYVGKPVTYTVPPASAGKIARRAATVPVEVVDFRQQLEPRSMADAVSLAKDMFTSRLFSAYGTPQSVLASILAGRELGLQSMASLRGFHIVEGKPTLAADLIRALVIQSGKALYFRCTERTAERATFTTKRKDDPDAPELSMTFTVDEAKTAQLGGWNGTQFKTGSGWFKSPADQCVARASAKLARLAYPEVVFGLYDPSELEA